MKKIHPLLYLIPANLVPLAYCLLYPLGAPIKLFLFPITHIALFLLNIRTAKTWPQIIIPSLLHIASTVCSLMHSGWLYLHYICYDAVGYMIIYLECIAGLVITIILMIVSLVLCYFASKNKIREA